MGLVPGLICLCLMQLTPKLGAVHIYMHHIHIFAGSMQTYFDKTMKIYFVESIQRKANQGNTVLKEQKN